MELSGYFDVFPGKADTELRTVQFANDSGMRDVLVGGTFIFAEYFCTDPECHCQRVLIKVFRAASEDACPEEVATISYSWNPDSDMNWSKLNFEMPNPFLDPLHPQAPYADELLEFWTAMIERDTSYALRIRRHYDEIREEVGAPTETWVRPLTAGEAGDATFKFESEAEPGDGLSQSLRDAGDATMGPPRTRRMRQARQKLLARARRRR